MAKISARGDREVARWRRPITARHGASGVLVLTEQGRLLEKLSCDTTYRVRRPRGAKRWTAQHAGAQAAVLGYERVAARV